MTDGLKDEHRAAIIAAIAANDRVERAVLFGSRATGTNTLSSDVDIALIGDRLTLTDQARLAAALDEIPMAQEIDLVLYDSIRDHALREQIRRDGVEWYADPNDGSDRMTLATATGAGDLSDPLPSDWERSTLGEVCERSGGNIQTGPFGSQLHASDYRPEGIPSIMPQNLGDNRVIEDGISRIGELDASRLRRYLVREGDIVYSRRGDVEKRALIGPREDGWLCGTGCLRVRLGENGVDPRYASYYLGHPVVREWIVRHAHGATMPNLNTAILSACPFVVPPPSEQRAIAHILGTLDDKIELSRRMNETLETMARALFKSWFSNFDPVRAKMEGRDTGLPKVIADLFPDGLVDSELGEIPDGWESARVDDVATITKGRSYRRRELDASDTALVTLKSFARGGGYRQEGLKAFQGEYKDEQVVHPGDVIVACTDVTQAAEVIGRSAVVSTTSSFRTLVASLDVLIVRPKNPSPGRAFVYHLTGSDDFVAHVLARTTGTTVLHLSKDAVSSFRFALPVRALAERFDQYADSLRACIQAIGSEVELLADVRNTLLRKLISGELRVQVMDPPREEWFSG